MEQSVKVTVMKKNYIFYVCAAAALVFTSCQKETPASEGTEPTPSGLDVITATTVSTKTTTQDGVNVLWEDGDQIGLYSDRGRYTCATYTTELASASEIATFVAENNTAIMAGGRYYAIYPASSFTQWASDMTQIGCRGYAKIPASQTAVKGGWDRNAGILAASSGTSAFVFNHVSAYVKFTVAASTTPFVSMSVTSIGGATLSDDKVNIYYDADNAIRVAEYASSSEKSSTVTLSNGGSAFEEGTYYVAFLPGTYADGLAFSFENAAGKVVTVSKTGSVSLNPGDVANLGTIGELQFSEPLQLCSVYEENGVKQGVVFWVDPQNPSKGKIISLEAKTTNWSKTAPKGDAVEENLRFTSDDPLENHDAVTALDDYDDEGVNYPAVYFCDEMRKTSGGNWHLPSLQELADFASTYYNKSLNTATTSDLRNDADAKSATERFDTIVMSAGGNQFTGVEAFQYWTGKEKIGGGKIKICAPRFGNYAPGMSLEHTVETGIARCVRDVELQ